MDNTTKPGAPAPAGRTIADWTQDVGIARATFYLIDDDCKPASVKIGRRRIIIERGADWLARMAQRGGPAIRRPKA